MNIKRIAAIAAAVVMAAGICTSLPMGNESVSSLAVTAEAAENDLVIKTDFEGKKYIAKYNGDDEDITIPSDISYIGELAFARNKKIKSVTFPKNCSVQYAAFQECTSLKKVMFKGDAEIGQSAFSYCINLENVTIGGSINNYIMEGAFRACQSLKKIKISKNKHEFSIYDYAFQDCISLQSINIPDKCVEICPGAFKNCFSLSNVTIPAKTELYTQCFGYATIFKNKKDFINANKKSSYYEEVRDDDSLMAVTDGKTKCYYYYEYVNKNGLAYKVAEYTPKQLTLTVTKGSPAEKYAKENKIKYTYASSSSISATVPAPTDFKASKTNNSVTLSWDKVSGADLYRVYKYNEKAQKYEKYKDVTSAKCTISGLSANTKYQFKVTAYDKVNGKYVKGGTSKAISVTTKQ